MPVQSFQVQGVSPAAAGPVPLGILRGLGEFDALSIIAEIRGATGGSLDVYLQMSSDQGTTWFDYIHFPQLAAGAPLQRLAIPVAREWQPTAAITAIGRDLAPALAANTSLGGEWGDMLRVLCVAGAGTSAGQTQTITIIGTRRRAT